MVDNPWSSLAAPPTNGIVGLSTKLSEALENIQKLRGLPEDWSAKFMVVTRFIAGLGPNSRVLCRGVWQGVSRHAPAVLVYNEGLHTPEVWVVIDDEGNMEATDMRYFYSDRPHQGIAREVLSTADGNSTI